MPNKSKEEVRAKLTEICEGLEAALPEVEETYSRRDFFDICDLLRQLQQKVDPLRKW